MAQSKFALYKYIKLKVSGVIATSRHMHHLAAEIHQIRRSRTAFGEPSAISATRRHKAKE